MLRRSLVFIAVGLFLTGCQSSMLKSFEKIHPGMAKDQVLEKLGSPNTSTRLHGKDRWIYRFYEDDIRFDKEVHFTDGIVVYTGDPWKPAPEKSAEARDKQNEELNAKDDSERKERSVKLRDEYQKYQDEARNHDKVRYMPQFKDVE